MYLLIPSPGYSQSNTSTSLNKKVFSRVPNIYRPGGMRGVWRTTFGRVNSESSDELTWEIGGEKMPMDTPERYRGPDIQDVLPK